MSFSNALHGVQKQASSWEAPRRKIQARENTHSTSKYLVFSAVGDQRHVCGSSEPAWSLPIRFYSQQWVPQSGCPERDTSEKEGHAPTAMAIEKARGKQEKERETTRKLERAYQKAE